MWPLCPAVDARGASETFQTRFPERKTEQFLVQMALIHLNQEGVDGHSQDVEDVQYCRDAAPFKVVTYSAFLSLPTARIAKTKKTIIQSCCFTTSR